MYPIVRFAKDAYLARKAPKLGMFDTHVSRHICWPWDLDPWMELNNGRTLTLYDLGRIPLVMRTGLDKVLRRQGWGMAVAGATVRYRRRVRAMERFDTHSRLATWDHRFLYLEQSMWKTDGECASHVVLRSAVTSKAGIVPPARVLDAVGVKAEPPAMPGWLVTWIESEAARPWPPMQDG